jgi:hypothetical protein
MLTFTVHEPPDPPADRVDRAERLAFVRDGFSWSAALLTPIWMLAHRLWWPFAGYLAAETLLAMLARSDLIDPGWASVAGLALGLVVGFEADSLRRWSLKRRGWSTIGAVSGRNAEDCERRWFDIWLPTQPILAQRAAPTGGAAGDAAGARGSRLGALSGAQS